ncbi:MAG: hypothetical protein LC785_14945 [Acidobacteria bacterium]|nr:hypothetical protein [Acidobacteriota bacterium]MCA1643209.1 hypothetical protein [Acidobacteriota bacterium]
MSDDERLTNLTEFARLMMQWARNAEEGMTELRAAQTNSEAKIAALADAQNHTEESMARLSDKMVELAAQQAHTDQRLDALIDIVREGREGKPPQ